MSDLSAPIQLSAARRWASSPARQASVTDLIRAAVWLSPVLIFVGVAMMIDAFIPGEPYPQSSGLSGWIVGDER